MDTNYQQILRIAADALSLKYSLDHAVFYWRDNQNSLVSEASMELPSGEFDAGFRLSISESLMTAIRKPLVITKSDTDIPRQQIIIPLIDNNQKLGVMAFWGTPAGEAVKETDRRFLDMIGLISLRVLLGLRQGRLVTDSQNLTLSREETAAINNPVNDEDDTIEFIKVGPIDDDDFQSPLSTENEEDFLEVPSTSELGIEPQSGDEDEFPDFSDVADELQSVSTPAIPRDMERLLQISEIGFLMFDKHSKIRTDHPLVNPEFFKLDLEQKTALEVLFEWGKPANNDSASFDKTPKYEMIQDLMQSVFSRITDIDVLKELLPVEVAVNDKTYGLGYHYQKSSVSVDNDCILAVFRDISKEKSLAARYATEIERTNMIIKVALDIDGYYQYRRSTESAFELIEEELAKPPANISLELIQHQIQAVQGGAEIYEINEVSVLAEELISTLELKLVGNTPLSKAVVESLQNRTNQLKERFLLLQKQYLNNLVSDEQILDKAVYRNTKAKIFKIRDQIIDGVLKRHMDELEGTFEKNYKPFTHLKSLEDITLKRLNRIKEHIREEVVEAGAAEITDIMSELRKQPIGLMFKRYAIIAVNLGERLKKRVEVEIKGADIEVPFHSLENVFTGLTYVIRNCVEHGLETMEERIDLDKSLEGNISIEAELEEDILRINISDDGRGIDVDRIRQAAIKNRVVSETEANNSSEEQILQLMFSKGFSTKKDSNGTFGRGVGLSAVGTAIEELGGEIRVQTRLRKGTSIIVEIPL